MPYSSAAAEILFEICVKRISNIKKKVFTISIDGPTASGKTICANALADLLKQQNYHVQTFQLDWALIDREKRENELSRFRENNAPFELEAELHMRLEVLEHTLREVESFNNTSAEKMEIPLRQLYSREAGGKEVGTTTLTLLPDTILIIEGHYGLRAEFERYIDLNTILIGKQEVLIERKVDRVKDYRDPTDAIDYFHFVDLPSIRKHVHNFWGNAHVVLDNTDVRAPRILNNLELKRYYEDHNPVPTEVKNFAEAAARALSYSDTVTESMLEQLQTIISFFKEVDLEIRKRLTLSIMSNTESMREYLVTRLREIYRHRIDRLDILDTTNVKNIYTRQFPLTVLASFRRNEHVESGIIQFTVQNNLTYLNIFHLGRVTQLRWSRDLEYEKYLKDEVTRVRGVCSTPAGRIRIQKPTPFIDLGVPIDESLPVDIKVTGKEDTVYDIGTLLDDFIHFDDSIWIHRFPLHTTVRHLVSVLTSCGVLARKVGNYLIACKPGELLYSTDIESVLDRVRINEEEQARNTADEEAADALTLDERESAYRALNGNSNSLVYYIDGELFSKVTMFSEQYAALVNELCALLTHDKRLVRKAAAEYMLKYFPDLKLSTRNIWPLVPKDDAPEIAFADLVRISPTILAELFMWLGLRNQASAVLGANIYDIRPNHSLDGYSYLRAASEQNRPLVVQTSLNAIGHREGDSEGYLRLESSPDDYINSVMNSARKLFLSTGRVTLFGLGIDHLNSGGDTPTGRTKRFADKLFATRRMTYYVLDAESLFNAASQDDEALLAAYDKMIAFMHHIIENHVDEYLVDKEICVSELNYIGKNAGIPTPEHMKLFVEAYRAYNRENGLGYINTRPHLFIGNLGTTHHSGDADSGFDTSIAQFWVDAVLPHNFVSAVLHGTTSTARTHLIKASRGCHKINIAGEFLKELTFSVPPRVGEVLGEFDANTKRIMPEVSRLLERMEENELESTYDHMTRVASELMDDINTPRLDDEDIEHFQHKQYLFEPDEVEEVRRALNELRGQQTSIYRQPTRAATFAPSLIEVPFGDEFKNFARALNELGAKYFHIDVGDGDLIPRRTDATDKVHYLKEFDPNIKIGTHLMVRDPHLTGYDQGRSYVDAYVEAGSDFIGFHINALSSGGVDALIDRIKECGAKPGLIIENLEPFSDLHRRLILDHGIEWVVCMSVPIGYGGQQFDRTVLPKLAQIHDFCKSSGAPLRLEVDGGLTMDNIHYCRAAGADTFAGWSIIKAGSQAEVLENYVDLIKELNKDG